jgi:uncharacterized protein (DUF736 family)
MAVIGTFQKQAGGDTYVGQIRTLALNVSNVTIRAAEKSKDTAPDYRIYAGNVEIGAAWEKTGKESGAEYLSVKVDDPSLPGAINANLVQKDNDTYELIWSR